MGSVIMKEMTFDFLGGLGDCCNILCHLIMICVVTGLLSGKRWEIAPGTLKLKGDSGLIFVRVGWRLLPSTMPFGD
jgi:hypothetical protein